MDYLEIVDAQGRRRHIKLDQTRFLIGREATCDICLPHPNVSRRHAQLQRTDQGDWLLQDLNSLNHVYLDDRPVQQILLEPGVAVRIADYRLALGPIIVPTSVGRSTIPLDDSSTVWRLLDTSWLEHMQEFERALADANIAGPARADTSTPSSDGPGRVRAHGVRFRRTRRKIGGRARLPEFDRSARTPRGSHRRPHA